MYLFQCLTILFTVTCSALGDDGVNDVQEFRKNFQIDNMIEELLSVDSREMELLHLTRYKNSSETQLYISLSRTKIYEYYGAYTARCPLTLTAQSGMRILNSHVVVKALTHNRTILQWIEVMENPSALGSSALLKHLEIDIWDCASKKTEVIVDADQSFFPAALNGTNILLVGNTFEILYPRTRVCERRWCRLRFYSGLSLKSTEKSPFAYQPLKTLIAGGSLHSDHLWVLNDPDVTELWLVNETSGSLIKDSTLPRNNDRVTFTVGTKNAVWCTQDRDRLRETSCTMFFLPGNNTGIKFAKLDHGDDILWAMPSTVMNWDGLVLITLKRSYGGKCNVIVTKQYSPDDGSHKSKVVFPDVECAGLSNFEAAREKLKIFRRGESYCLSSLDHKQDIHFVVKCFEIRILAKSK